ncbi:hypothetical protein MAR_012678, partial [Mya arenaria]
MITGKRMVLPSITRSNDITSRRTERTRTLNYYINDCKRNHVHCTTDADCTGACDTVGQQAECYENECHCHPYVNCTIDAHCEEVVCDTIGHQALCHENECHCHIDAEECEQDWQCVHCGANSTCDAHFCHGIDCIH